jgi:cobalt-zinc-cadmium efflux system outer membrane protein
MKLAKRKTSLMIAGPLAVVLSIHSGVAHADDADSSGALKATFRPTADLDLHALQGLVAAHAPGVEAARLDVEIAAAGVEKSNLLPNPTFDASWGTIPIGSTNPVNLASPMTQVPNYSVGLSYTFPIGKRKPLQDRARAIEQAAKADLDGSVRERAIILAHTLGAIATTTLRLQGLRHMADEGHKNVEMGQVRLAASFGSELDVDRLRVEAQRLDQSVLGAESDLNEVLSACAVTLGKPCESFADAAEARRFLVHWIDASSSLGSIEERPDVRSLAARAKAAEAETRWAKAQAIPDPTVRLGYLRDQFIISGNQLNSVNVSVIVPLPIFDHGQAELMAARAAQLRFTAQRDKTVEVSESRRAILRDRLEAQKKRQHAVSEEMLPRAERTLQEVARAVESRLLPLTEVIQAQRTVSELIVAEADSFSDAYEASIEMTNEFVKKGDDKP